MITRRAFLFGLGAVASIPFLPRETKDRVALRQTRETVPTGYLVAWSHDSIPKGWVPCEGQMLKKEEYPELYEVIGTTYGGSLVQFHVPEMRAFYQWPKKSDHIRQQAPAIQYIMKA